MKNIVNLTFWNYHKNDEIKDLKLQNILFSKNNPRFTLLNGLNIDLVNFIKDGTYEMNQHKIFFNLLQSEGDLSDLLTLFKSIKKFGFSNESEPIFLVPSKEKNTWVVAEGNRRIMCLKILIQNGEYSLPNFDIYYSNAKNVDDNNTIYENESNEIEDDEFKIKTLTKKNYDEIVQIINEILLENKDYKVYIDKVLNNESDKLWKMIYDKHLTGKRPGMRDWSRAKYFADLLYTFKDGIYNNDEDLQIFKNINREKRVVISDFKEAQFVYSCFYFYYRPNDEEVMFYDEEVLNELKLASKISSLEKNHSYNKIKNFAIQHVFNNLIDGDNFDRNYIKIEFDKTNNRIKFIQNKIRAKDFLYKIFDLWKRRIITTRNFKNVHFVDLIAELNVLLNDIKINNELSREELDEINENNLSNKQINDIISANFIKYKNSKNNPLERFELQASLRDKNKKISTQIDKINNDIFKWDNVSFSPIYAFKIFYNQLEHNCKDFYFNAMFCSIRSFMELLIMFGTYFILDNSNLKDECCREIAGDRIAKKKSDYFIHYYQKNNEKINWKSNRHKFLENVLINNRENKFFEEISTQMDEFIWEEEKWKEINSFIHASHKLYINDSYIKNKKLFCEFQELVSLLIEQTNWPIFLDLSETIKDYIIKTNKPL